jgi:hypothetical protein
MRLHNWVVAAAMAFGIPAVAAAQEGTTTTTTKTEVKTSVDADHGFNVGNQGFASVFVGSNFGAMNNSDLSGSSLDFGGAVGYMWRKSVGAEFLAGFTPNFELHSNVLFGERPQVNSYMANVIGAIPLGSEGQWQPFISGGLGALTLRSDVLSGSNTGDVVNQTLNPNDTQFGGNIGGGVMGFTGSWGFRADVRYFRGFTSNDAVDAANPIADNILSGLDFWRANIGVAVRW